MKKNRREAFDKFEYEPTPEVWKNIEKNLPVKKKRRFFLLWFLPLMLVAGIIWKWNYKTKSNFIPVEKAESNYSSKRTYKNAEKSLEANNNITKDHQKYISSDQIVYENKINERNDQANSKKSTRDKFVATESFVKPNLNNTEINSPTSYNRTGNVAENFMILPALYTLISAELPEKEVIKRENNSLPKKMLSRWTLFAEAGILNSSFSEKTKKEVGSTDFISIDRFSWGGGIGYDINSRWRFSVGISSIIKGAGENSEHTIILNGKPGDPTNTYTIVSSSGDLNGSGRKFDLAYFGSENLELFPLTANLAPTQDVQKRVYFSTRKEFQMIQFPLSITYKFSGGKLTPEVGMSFSPEYLNKYAVYLNDKRLDYQYTSSIRKIVFSAGVQAGLCYSLSPSFGVFMEAGYSKGLSSLHKVETINPVSKRFMMGVNFRIGYKK